jgi:hypothetical protein
MKEILGYIPRLLSTEENIAVPGLGVFGSRYLPASIHPVLHTLSPPSVQLTFVASACSGDRLFAERLALWLMVSEHEALGLITDAVAEMMKELETTGSSRVDGFGLFSYDAAGVLVFKPCEGQEGLPRDFGLSEICSPAIIRERKGKTQQIRKSKRSNTTARHIPPVLKLAIWLGIPLIAVVIFFIIQHITPAELFARVTGHEPQTGTHPKGTVPAEVRFSTGSGSIRETMIRPVRDAIYRQADLEPSVLIIGNCFSHEEYARQYLAEIRGKGFTGAGMMITEGAMPYHVFLERLEKPEEAQFRLEEIRKQAPQAWLLEILADRL